jgi:3-phosphoglycerate kinase
MRSIKEIENLEGKRVLLRVDFNVPLENGTILDDFRIKKAIPTIEYLLTKGAFVTILAHLGKDGSASLDPIIERFFELSKFPKEKIKFYPNIRKFPGEEANDPEFAKDLAKEGDIYVNDAFSVSHREHASVVGVSKLLPHYAGFQLEEEVRHLSTAIKNPEHPFLFILGGAKFSTKVPLIEKYLELADNVFIGGALANNFLKTKGYEVGQSLTDESSPEFERILKNPKLIIPADVVVLTGDKLVSKDLTEIKNEDVIVDIGEKTVTLLGTYIEKSKLILWNGPLGKYEVGGEKGTKKILELVANSQAKSILGGGDTAALVTQMGLEDKFTFVSTGGGATLDFLAKGTLSGIDALN